MNELHDTQDEIELPALDVTSEDIELGERYKLPDYLQPDDLQDLMKWWIKLFSWMGGAIQCRERQLKSSLAANREQKAEIERLKAELNRYPADWWQDSSLKTWFPFTAEELDRLKAELASLRASVGEKPEDAYERGQLEMRTRMNNTLMTHGSSIVGIELLKYVAPTLPGEEK